jgi:hypothetical protein
MKYRKLRIAWSVFWGIVAVLLVALWVRSYYRDDICGVTFAAQQRWNFASRDGKVCLGIPNWEHAVWAIGKKREWIFAASTCRML